MRKHKGRRAFLTVCTVPALILFAVFMLYPTLNIFIISMYKWGGYSLNKEFLSEHRLADCGCNHCYYDDGTDYSSDPYQRETAL